jgi:hypothetical protein
VAARGTKIDDLVLGLLEPRREDFFGSDRWARLHDVAKENQRQKAKGVFLGLSLKRTTPWAGKPSRTLGGHMRDALDHLKKPSAGIIEVACAGAESEKEGFTGMDWFYGKWRDVSYYSSKRP